ncbi:MAG: CYTH domain-containing protein, partial [Actinomycetota bacterium]|nr:CYTH domain-containing protein [Actinomycetota bacterium]
MTVHAEHEVKLGSWAGFRLPSLEGIGEGITAVALPDQLLHAVYYDTDDLRLARWGVTLRYRTGDPSPGPGADPGQWTLKLPRAGGGDGHGSLVRGEIVCEGSSSRVPDEAADLVRGYVRTAVLEPVARLRTRRRGIALRDATGQAVAEVVDDEVS